MTLPALRGLIDQHFSDEELSQLCFNLSIEYENLPGDTHIAKAQSLVEYGLRHGRLQPNRPITKSPDWNSPGFFIFNLPPYGFWISGRNNL